MYLVRYPYKSNGYISEPEPYYDSDYCTKYDSLDRRRTAPQPPPAPAPVQAPQPEPRLQQQNWRQYADDK